MPAKPGKPGLGAVLHGGDVQGCEAEERPDQMHVFKRQLYFLEPTEDGSEGSG